MAGSTHHGDPRGTEVSRARASSQYTEGAGEGRGDIFQTFEESTELG